MKLDWPLVLVGLVLLYAIILQLKPDSDAGLAGDDGGAFAPVVPAEAQAPGESSSSPEAGVRFSGQVVQGGSKPTESVAPSEARDAGSSPALATILDRFEFSTPTPDDIAWLTIDLWEQEEFLELTQSEAHELLASEDTLGLWGPTSMRDVIGPMPTHGDCRIGFRDLAVQAALQEVLLYEAVLIELGSIPAARRDHWAAQRLQELVRMRDSAMVDLMLALETATTYPHWSLWWRLYQRWNT